MAKSELEKVFEAAQERAFEGALSELEVRTEKIKDWTNLWGFLGAVSTVCVRVPGEEEIPLEAAKRMFYMAYDATLQGCPHVTGITAHGNYHITSKRLDHENEITLKYFFDKGVELAEQTKEKLPRIREILLNKS